MTRADYKKGVKEQLSEMDANELKAFARKEGIRLHTNAPNTMCDFIAETMTTRHFHGDAFRMDPIEDRLEEHRKNVTVNLSFSAPDSASLEGIRDYVKKVINSKYDLFSIECKED